MKKSRKRRRSARAGSRLKKRQIRRVARRIKYFIELLEARENSLSLSKTSPSSNIINSIMCLEIFDYLFKPINNYHLLFFISSITPSFVLFISHKKFVY